MNDHNLDDLIIDNIDPKNSKTKSFLTIIALAIVLLIVAIILTKTNLKDSQEKAILEEDDTAFISPDLTLQDKPKTVPAPKAVEKVENIKEEVALGKKETLPEVKHQETHTAKVSTKTSKEDTLKEKREKAKARELQRKKEKEAADAQKKAKAQKEIVAQKEIKSKKNSTTATGYFIQVGSFSQTPSARFLTVIKNSGFSYQITAIPNSSTKKLLIGPYSSREEANTALVRVKDRINKSAFVIKK